MKAPVFQENKFFMKNICTCLNININSQQFTKYKLKSRKKCMCNYEKKKTLIKIENIATIKYTHLYSKVKLLYKDKNFLI